MPSCSLEALSTANGGDNTSMGSLVGTSDEVRQGAGGDVTLNDYYVVCSTIRKMRSHIILDHKHCAHRWHL